MMQCKAYLISINKLKRYEKTSHMSTQKICSIQIFQIDFTLSDEEQRFIHYMIHYQVLEVEVQILNKFPMKKCQCYNQAKNRKQLNNFLITFWRDKLDIQLLFLLTDKTYIHGIKKLTLEDIIKLCTPQIIQALINKRFILSYKLKLGRSYFLHYP